MALFMSIIFTFGFSEEPNEVGQRIGHIGERRTLGYAAHGAAGTLTPAADALEASHPLAATVLRRAMIQGTLDGAKSKRYAHAARHPAECQSCDPAIKDHGDLPSHQQFLAALRQKHGRKHGFWQLVDG